MPNTKDEISICLIEPQYPINLGYVARIMKNFGFHNLLVVNSQVNIDLNSLKSNKRKPRTVILATQTIVEN